ncbi:MAG: TIGR02452 family protein [Chitinophagales bacterium]
MIQFEEENSWNHFKWLSQFKKASKRRQGFRELRVEVFRSTVRLVKTGFYFVEGEKIFLDNQQSDFSDTVYYKSPNHVSNIEVEGTCGVSVINADCIETARLIALSGYKPVVLNMANPENPGGGVLRGAGAQEENIFRRSNLFRSLYQFVGYGERVYGTYRHPEYSYPLQPETGGIYSPNITIFRGSEHNGYCLLREPYQLAFVTVAAMYSPELVIQNGVFRIADSFVEPTKQKIRTILRIAILNGHDSAVLSAFGCGAFCNPPNHVALLFQEVFKEDEFRNKLKLIVFAIIDDHNAWKSHNPNGNVLPFLKVFG